MTGSSMVLLTKRAPVIEGLLPCQRENPRLWFSDLPADLDWPRRIAGRARYAGTAWLARSSAGSRTGCGGGEIFEQGAITGQKRPRGRPPGQGGHHASAAGPMAPGRPS